MDASDFAELLFRRPLEQVVHEEVFNAPAFVAQGDANAEQLLKDHLCSELPIQGQNISIVGSAKTGFSLSPDSFPRPFSPASDIDVLVVDDALFDEIWLSVLTWHYPRKGTHLQGLDRGWMLARRRGLYWGALRPDELEYRGVTFPSSLIPVRDIATKWFTAFKSVTSPSVFSGRETRGLLYRTWDHAILYHAEGLRRIKRRIEQERQGRQ